MEKKKRRLFWAFLVIVSMPCLATAAWQADFTRAGWRSDGRNLTLTAKGSINIPGTGRVVETAASVALTSPTVTFNALNRRFITLTANANLTGVRPTGGKLGQIITIISGAGSNTMRLDDDTSMSLGGNNVTLTEGSDDCITLRCMSAAGDEWRVLSTAAANSGMTLAGDLVLDDNAGASPSFIMRDGTNEAATVSKVDSGYLTVTTPAADGVNVLVGNLKIGNGTTEVTPNGEDLYVEGYTSLGGLRFTRTDVSLVSPAVSIATGGASYVNIQTDANQTSPTLTGGVIGQIVILKAGSGSNTLIFDDGETSMTLAGNFTMTEGQGDILTLMCVHADGDEWTEMSRSDN